MPGRFAAWSVAGYRTALRDDIQFIATGTGAVNTGYFTNIGGTARTGAELGASVPLGAVTLGARFSYTRATFDTTFREHSPNNATADSDGAITIHRGNRIPGIPAQLLKLRADWTVTPVVEVGMSMNAASAQYAHGNENNADPAGRVPGYVVFNLDAAWRMAPGWELVANLVNVLDRRYQTFGTLGSNFFRGPGDTFAPELALAEAFRGVAAPRAAWVAVRFTWDDAR
jgi:outer membrane receptor protein involved in Fe transport